MSILLQQCVRFRTGSATLFVCAAILLSGCMGRDDGALRVVIASDRHFDKAAKVIVQMLESRRREMKIGVSVISVDLAFPDRDKRLAEIVDLRPQLVIAVDEKAVLATREAGYKGPVLFISHLALTSPEVTNILAWKLPPAVLSTHFVTHKNCLAWLRELAGSRARIGILSHSLRANEMPPLMPGSPNHAVPGITVFQVATLAEAADLVGRSTSLNIDAWYALHSPAVWATPNVLAEAAIRARRPLAIEYSHYYARAGSLLACAIDRELEDSVVHAARLLLAGSTPAGLTYSAASSMSISINLETASKLGLPVPMALAMRARTLFPMKPATAQTN